LGAANGLVFRSAAAVLEKGSLMKEKKTNV
jgi:hypothetical protein